MFKKAVIIGFLLMVSFAFYLLHKRQTRQNLAGDHARDKTRRVPALSIDGMLMYSYVGDTLESRSIAGQAHYFSPDRVELDNRISLVRYREDGQTDSAFADKGILFLNSDGPGALMEKADLNRVELIENVSVKVNDHTLRTNYAEYFPKPNEIRTDLMVEITGPGRVFEGDSGFTYNLNTQNLEIFGIVSGRELSGAIEP